MLTDTLRLLSQLPLDAQYAATEVFDFLAPRPISEETRESLALAAGLRHIVEESAIHEAFARVAAIGDKLSFVRLLGFADAYSRRFIASKLARSEDFNRSLALACGIRSISNSRRCSNIWNVAISYAEKR